MRLANLEHDGWAVLDGHQRPAAFESAALVVDEARLLGVSDALVG